MGNIQKTFLCFISAFQGGEALGGVEHDVANDVQVGGIGVIAFGLGSFVKDQLKAPDLGRIGDFCVGINELAFQPLDGRVGNGVRLNDWDRGRRGGRLGLGENRHGQ